MSQNHRVSVWTAPTAQSPGWTPISEFGSVGGGFDQFNYPIGVAVSEDSLTAWVADLSNYRVAVWTRPNIPGASWSYRTQLGSGIHGAASDQFAGPMGIAISADGLTAWVVDNGNARVAVWTRPHATSTNWSYRTHFGSRGNGSGQLDGPMGIAVSSDGLTAWVADAGNYRIVVWTRPNTDSNNWSYSTRIGSGTEGNGTHQFGYPIDVAVSSDELTVWVADYTYNRIVTWTRPDVNSPTWTFSARIGGTGSEPDQFSGLNGVTVSADGLTMWVADTLNYRVSRWELVCPE